MNNSSAYNNVLLKPAVQTQATQSSASAKRNYQDDSSYASFQQSFKDAHEQVRPQNEKVTKQPAAKKTAQVDKPKSANDIEKKVPTKPADESRARDQVAANDKAGSTDKAAESNDKLSNSDAKDSANQDAANQNTSGQNSCGKDSSNTVSKSAAKKTTTDEEPTADIINTENLAALLQPQAAPAPIADVAPEVAEVIESGVTFVDAVVQTTSGVAVATEVVNSDLAAAASVDGTTNTAGVLTTNSAMQDQAAATMAGDQVSADVLTTTTQAAVVDLALQATAPVATPDTAAELAPVIAAAAVAGVLPKPAAAQTPLASTVEASDVEVATSVVSVLSSEIAVPKTATPVATPDAAVATDTTPDQTLDVKSTFEKMMQNVARPESGGRDEAQPAPTAPQAASNSSSTNSLDSMLRFSEAQTPAARSFVVQTAVPVPVGQPTWSQAVGDKVLWLAAQNVSSAEIHLNPENLGPMQVKVSVNQEHATVNFTSHHAVVREVLDQNLGRLRDMFNEQGLNLVNVDVSDKSFNRQQGEAKEQKGQAGNNELVADEEVQATASAIVQKRLVDHYA